MVTDFVFIVILYFTLLRFKWYGCEERRQKQEEEQKNVQLRQNNQKRNAQEDTG